MAPNNPNVIIVQPTNPSPVAQPTATQSPAAIPAPNVPAAMPTVPANAPTVGRPVQDDTQLNPANWPKETFRQGFANGANPSYTDVNGQIVSNAPAVKKSKLGVLGGILAGALEGASRGIAAQTPEGARGYGAAASAGAKAAEEGRIAADNRARAIAQLNFENQQKATQAKLEHNLTLAQTRDLLQKSQFEPEEHAAYMKNLGLEQEEHTAQIQKTLDDRRATMAMLRAELHAHGVDPHATLTQKKQDGKSLAGQAQPHIPAMVHGQSLPVQNGQTGDDNGVDLYATDQMNAPITGDPIYVPAYSGIISDGTGKDNRGNVIPKGQYIPTWTQVVPDGHTTYLDVAYDFFAADQQLDGYQKKFAAQVAQQQKLNGKEDPIDDALGGRPQQDPTTGKWMFGKKAYSSEVAAKIAYGNAYEAMKKQEATPSYGQLQPANQARQDIATYSDKYATEAATREELGDLIQAGQSVDPNSIANSLAQLAGPLMITTASGVHRVNTTEMQQFAGRNGLSWAERVNQYLDRGEKGQVPPEIAQDWQNIVKIYAQHSYQTYLTSVQIAANNGNLDPNQILVSTQDGNDTISLADALSQNKPARNSATQNTPAKPSSRRVAKSADPFFNQ